MKFSYFFQWTGTVGLPLLSQVIYCTLQTRKEHERSSHVPASQLFLSGHSNTYKCNTCCGCCQWYVSTYPAML